MTLPPLMPLARLVKPMASPRAQEPAAASAPRTRNPVIIKPGRPISQRMTTHCVGYSLTHILRATPAPTYGDLGEAFADRLWDWAVGHDADRRNDNDPEAGTDVWTACRWLARKGYIARPPALDLLWERELYARVALVGPAVIGGPWLRSMDAPDEATGEVTVDPASALRGGHAWPALWYRPEERVLLRGRKVLLPARYYGQQSWLGYAPFDVLPEGPQIFWIREDGMKRLMNLGANATPVTKIRPRVARDSR
ncbi:MAG TPA: hypothetical protein VIM61_00400 [Chthoniobacterales bacterium]